MSLTEKNDAYAGWPACCAVRDLSKESKIHPILRQPSEESVLGGSGGTHLQDCFS